MKKFLAISGACSAAVGGTAAFLTGVNDIKDKGCQLIPSLPQICKPIQRSSGASSKCHTLAAADWDPRRTSDVRGVAFDTLIQHARDAVQVCEQAVRETTVSDKPDDAEIGRLQFELGRSYDALGNKGDTRDFMRAQSNYLESYLRGYKAAALNLGILYEDGHAGTQRNIRDAAKYYKYAADEGIPQARYCYAIALVFGWPYGSDVDKQKFLKLDKGLAAYYLKENLKEEKLDEYVRKSQHFLDQIESSDDHDIYTEHQECNVEPIIGPRKPIKIPN